MATITGVTKAKMEEILNNTVVSARVENGVLYFMKGDNATETNVGRIFYPPIDSWPIGSIFMTERTENPSALLLGGTWVRWAKGRMPVSLDETQTEFNVVGKTGGAKRVQLTAAESGSPWSNLVRKLTGGNMYFNVGSDADAEHRAELLQPTNAAQSHENLPPYVTVYMWKRTA